MTTAVCLSSAQEMRLYVEIDFIPSRYYFLISILRTLYGQNRFGSSIPDES